VTLTVERSGVIDARDFEPFYRDHRDRLYRALALTLGDAALAAEAVDEAMTRALERWGEVAGYANAPGWVYRVAYNWAVSRIRRAGREVTAPADHGVWTDPDPADQRVLAAVAALPVDQRAVVVMRYFLDWSTEQMSSALDIPSGTVKSRLHRALADLAERMEAPR
jgi:RNA polymerase sigma factor (sigma-70 family)